MLCLQFQPKALVQVSKRFILCEEVLKFRRWPVVRCTGSVSVVFEQCSGDKVKLQDSVDGHFP